MSEQLITESRADTSVSSSDNNKANPISTSNQPTTSASSTSSTSTTSTTIVTSCTIAASSTRTTNSHSGAASALDSPHLPNLVELLADAVPLEEFFHATPDNPHALYAFTIPYI